MFTLQRVRQAVLLGDWFAKSTWKTHIFRFWREGHKCYLRFAFAGLTKYWVLTLSISFAPLMLTKCTQCTTVSCGLDYAPWKICKPQCWWHADCPLVRKASQLGMRQSTGASDVPPGCIIQRFPGRIGSFPQRQGHLRPMVQALVGSAHLLELLPPGSSALPACWTIICWCEQKASGRRIYKLAGGLRLFSSLQVSSNDLEVGPSTVHVPEGDACLQSGESYSRTAPWDGQITWLHPDCTGDLGIWTTLLQP